MRIFLLIVTISFWLLLDSCQKTKTNPDGGLSYGISGIEPQMAASGDTAWIYGAGFSSDTASNKVMIHGANARVLAASSGALQVIVPAAPGLGSIQVQTGSQSYTYNGTFLLATVVTGAQSQSTTWTAGNLYVLENKVEFLKGTRLTIQPGTIILGDKDSLASLVIDDGANISMVGTSANPIVFSSIEPLNLRLPGDWGGITLAASPAAGADSIKYVRIEYGGYHISNVPGAALEIDRSEPAGNIQYVQTSYSYGDGFRFAGGTGPTVYFNNLISFGDAGEDFSIEGDTRAFGQFLLGIKDPQFADQLGADGLLVQSSQPATISNLFLIGYDGISRNSVPLLPGQYEYAPTDYVVNNNSGRGIHVGGATRGGGPTPQLNGTLQLFNSVVAAPWLAGISFDGPLAWAGYENGPGGSTIHHTWFTFLAGGSQSGYADTTRSLLFPLIGYSFAAENLSSPTSAFAATDTTAQYAVFTSNNNDSAQLFLLTQYGSPVIDNLDIQNIVADSRLQSPNFTISNGSPLSTGADFSDPRLNDAFFDKTNVFIGTFGNDWTKGWANFNPLITSYQ